METVILLTRIKKNLPKTYQDCQNIDCSTCVYEDGVGCPEFTKTKE